ncbi:hypothetical protein K501DRAFT_272570 [Backusella circina FSU 941]|nr:hypothetical protein K501DRAFT_272570 [Backusella circina FSU 941]
MEKLSTEIFQDIFIELTLAQKQECLFVCHRWRNIIYNRSLLTVVYIPNPTIFREFLKMMNAVPSLGEQVEQLQLIEYTYYYCGMINILSTLPNLRLVEIIALDTSASIVSHSAFMTSKRYRVQSSSLFESCSQTTLSVTVQLSKVKSTLPLSYKKFKITKLNIMMVQPTIGIDTLVSKCFPHLQSLTLSNCLMLNSSLKLPECHLSYLSISYKGVVSISVLNKNETRYFNTEDSRQNQCKDYSVLSCELSPTSIDKIGSIIQLEVICGSVKKFVLNGLPATFLLAYTHGLNLQDDHKKHYLGIHFQDTIMNHSK